MADIFLATLGQRPEVITIALDLLNERYTFAEVVILHTEPKESAIATAYTDLKAVLKSEYSSTLVQWRELVGTDGSPIIDIVDQSTATHYYFAVYSILLEYKDQKDNLHLMVAGGRKAMSIYAMLAASVIFGEQDFVWTVLSPPRLINQPGEFHIPSGYRHQVQTVRLPLLPTRLMPNSLPPEIRNDPLSILNERTSRRLDFLNRLSKQERLLAEYFSQNPYLSTRELADLMGKSQRTLDYQFRSIYGKMISYLDLGDRITNKRQALLDILMD